MSPTVYGDLANRRAMTDSSSWRRVGGGNGIIVDRPMSRLSKRMTRKPLATRRSTNSIGQAMSWPPRPITSSSGSSPSSPWTSYSIVIPLTFAAAMGAARYCLPAAAAPSPRVLTPRCDDDLMPRRGPKICTILPEGGSPGAAPNRSGDDVAAAERVDNVRVVPMRSPVTGRPRAAVERFKLWENGRTLRVRFLDGVPEVQREGRGHRQGVGDRRQPDAALRHQRRRRAARSASPRRGSPGRRSAPTP